MNRVGNQEFEKSNIRASYNFNHNLGILCSRLKINDKTKKDP